jgi:hypothetical protein
MFKATHKRRATTLSKTFLTAGLLGGAALSTLGAGSAQADGWSTPIQAPGTTGQSTKWEFTTGTGTDPFNFANGTCSESYSFCMSPIIADKKLTLLSWFSIPGVAPNQSISDLEFSVVPGANTPWHVDLDFNPDDTGDPGGSLAYKIEIVDRSLWTADCNIPGVGCDDFFGEVDLLSARTDGTTVTKIYGRGWNPNATDTDGSSGVVTGVIDTLHLTTNNFDSGTSGGTVLYVKDYWTAEPGKTVDNLSNQFNQVPAPLPLLGVGAAFGSIRKLRKFSSQLKTFSMG